LERKTYEIIKEAGEVQPKNLPEPRIMGSVSNLKAKGLVTVFKKYTSWAHKKKKFVKVKKKHKE